MGVNGIYGLSGSGLDVESMVKTAMKAKQSQYDKLYKKEVKQEWTKSAYNDLYTSAFSYKYTTLSTYKMQSTMNAMAATSTDNKVATVSANGEAAAMSHKVTVNALTSNAYLQTTSAGISRDVSSTSKSISLKDIINSSIYKTDSTKPGVASYDTNTDKMILNDGTVITNASITSAISFRVKDAATSSTTEKYTTTTTDDKGAIVAGYVPGAVGSGSYTDSSGTTYSSTVTELSDGTIQTTLKDSGGTQKAVFITKTVDDKGNSQNWFRPVNSGSVVTEGSSTSTTTYTTTTKNDSGGAMISGFIPPAAGQKGVYTSGGVTYDTVSADQPDGTVKTTLTSQTDGTTLTYTTTTTDGTNTIHGYRPTSDSKLNTDGTFTTNYATTTTTTALSTDGSISTMTANNTLSNGEYVVYSYKDLYEKSLYDLATDISSANGNLTANYDSINDSLSIYNKNGGAANMVAISSFTGDYITKAGKTAAAASSTAMTNALFTHLNLGMYDGTKLNAAQELKDNNPLSAVGSSGSITIDGKTYKDLTSSKVLVAGVSYTLVATGSATVSVTQDTDTIVKNVKQFVDDYNKLLDSLNDKIYETNYVSGSTSNKTYDPLTDAEKKGMSNDEVTAWEAKAKKGLLYHSSVLSNIVSSMRTALSTPVEAVSSDYKTLGSIGISSSTDKGHIQLNEEKLKKALTADPDSVYQLFASSPKDDKDTDNMGVANRLDQVMTSALKSISEQAGTSASANDQSYLGLKITSMKEKMSDFQTSMNDYQTRLYKKYDAMEAAIAKLNAQTSYVSQAFSS